MLFNSLNFVCFFVCFFILYWLVFNRKTRSQNYLLLLGSCFFYSWWNWHFLFLLIGVSAVNYTLAILIDKTGNEKKKAMFLYLGLIVGLGNLMFFKYYDFFIDSLMQSFLLLNIKLNLYPLKLVLPLGISFYTFRMLSYLLDVNNGKIKPVKDWLVFFSYSTFFPSIISGPIDKARTLVPQLEKGRVFNYNSAADGMRQILWGVFKKLVIADNCAILTDKIFDNYETLPASTLVLGAFYFTIQVYADFSGYSDMAIGISRLLGFDLAKNFDFPFFSQNIAEFWRKWHISLTSWMTEYVYTPLSISFRDYGKWGAIGAILITFTIIGVWHDSNWTFILFGLIHGCFFIPLIIRGTVTVKTKQNKTVFYSITKYLNMIITFALVAMSIVLFRLNTISSAIKYYKGIWSFTLFEMPNYFSKTTFVLIAFFITTEWIQKGREHALQIDYIENSLIRYVIYFAIISIIILMGYFTQSSFIYIKF